jgi:hypothetical protein
MIELRAKYKKLGLELIVQSILKDYLFERSKGSGAEVEEFVDFSLACYLEAPTDEIYNVVMEMFLEKLMEIKKKS